MNLAVSCSESTAPTTDRTTELETVSIWISRCSVWKKGTRTIIMMMIMMCGIISAWFNYSNISSLICIKVLECTETTILKLLWGKSNGRSSCSGPSHVCYSNILVWLKPDLLQCLLSVTCRCWWAVKLRCIVRQPMASRCYEPLIIHIKGRSCPRRPPNKSEKAPLRGQHSPFYFNHLILSHQSADAELPPR